MGVLAPVIPIVGAITGAIGAAKTIKDVVDPPEVEFHSSHPSRAPTPSQFNSRQQAYFDYLLQRAPDYVGRHRQRKSDAFAEAEAQKENSNVT